MEKELSVRTQILISTMHQVDTSILDKMNILYAGVPAKQIRKEINWGE